jgi:general secretion pathway protein E
VNASDVARWQALAGRDRFEPHEAAEIVDVLLTAAHEAGASDVHLQPNEAGLEIRWRLDGVLQPAGTLRGKIGPNLIARLKVLADLLTYRLDVPQEGRIRGVAADGEMRVSVFPTIHGERAVIRLFAAGGLLQRLADLRLPQEVRQALEQALRQTSGLVLVTGPAGCGKTTTVYACLRELAAASAGSRSIASLEDPVEVALPGVAQSQVQPAAGFGLASGLRFLLRQDPEVIMVGEIRDRDTAEVVMQAALTGHLVLSTFHAGSTCEAIGRLLDMGIEPYVLRSAAALIISQRLLRQLCNCKQLGSDPGESCGLPLDAFHTPQGCQACKHTGYQGRAPVAEMLRLADAKLSSAVLNRADVVELQRLAAEAGFAPLRQSATEAVAGGLTSPAEVVRVLGLGRSRSRETSG